jgi:hypothetical protein
VHGFNTRQSQNQSQALQKTFFETFTVVLLFG